MQEQTRPKVAILLCTFHGQHYLADQLESFAKQSYSNWEVWASDDGSQDDTHAILVDYQNRWANKCLSIHYGPKEGFVANFLSLTCNTTIEADFYAYSDQDDIWEPDKLERAISRLKTVPENTAALYCGRTCLVDKNNNEIGLSPLFIRSPGFANALIQNIGGGNTMVFNKAARELMLDVGENIDVVAHDWWAYMLVSGCGGKVFYDSYPSLRYRQHDNNLVGSNVTWKARFIRVRMLLKGRFRSWNDLNIEVLQSIEEKLTPENRSILSKFVEVRTSKLIPRLVGLKKSGVYRQTLLGNLGLILAAILNKL